MATIDIQGFIDKLNNGEIDLDTWAAIVNSNSLTVETRLNGNVNTWFGLQAALSAATGRVFFTKAQMDAAPGTMQWQAARVTADDVSASNNGLYIWSGSAWVSTNDPLRVGPLLSASGADYPLLKTVRNGQISAADSTLNRYLLKVELLNVDPAYVFRFAYFGNGGYVSANRDAIVINKYKKDTYATAAVREDFITTSNIIPQFTRDGTVQTVLIESTVDGGAFAKVTIDTSKLPTYGTPLNYEGTAGTASYSWIIDPSLYYPKAPISANPLTISAGNDYPLKRMVRDGITSNPDTSRNLNGWLLDAKVTVPGTNDDYYYRLEYIGNGFYPGNPDAIVINKYLKSTYETASVAIPFIRTSDPTPEFPRDGRPQTINIKSVLEPGAVVQLTFDTAKMPTYGTAINYQGANAPTKSWIIDPSRVTLVGSTPVTAQGGVMPFDYTASTKTMRYAYQSNDKLYRVSIGPNSYNNLPNIKTVEAANYGIAPTYTSLIDTTGDSLAPIKIKATTGNLEVSPRLTYSGGNHGRGGASNGYRTGLNILLQFAVDGAMIDMTKDLSGSCSKIGIEIVNALRASNTVDSQPITFNGTLYNFTGAVGDPAWIEGMVEPDSTIRRYVVHQCFNVTCSPFGMSVEGKIIPLEAGVRIFEDNALQMFTGGFNSTIMYADGQQGERISFVPSAGPNSGPSSTYPKAWLVSFKGAGGMAGIWIDKDYGIGDGRYIDPTRYNFQTNSSAKCYAAVVRAPLTGPDGGYDYDNPDGGYLITDDYVWRGGYFWSQDTATTDFDSVIPLAIGGERKFAYIKPDSTSMRF